MIKIDRGNMEELEYLQCQIEDMQDNLVRFYLKELKITKDLLEFIKERA